MALVFADDFTSFDTSVWNYDVGDGSDYGLQRSVAAILSVVSVLANCGEGCPAGVAAFEVHPMQDRESATYSLQPVFGSE
jgi:hypothetical protein